MKRFALLAAAYLALTGYGPAGGYGAGGEAIVLGCVATAVAIDDAVQRAENVDASERAHLERVSELLPRANAGDSEAQYALADLSSTRAERWAWLCRAAQGGHARAQFLMAARYSAGAPKPFVQDDLQAYVWYGRAAANGEASAQIALPSAADQLTAQEMAEAQRRLAAWTPDASQCDKEPTGIGRERTRSGTAPPRCRDVGGYEAHMRRTGRTCRLE